MIPKRFKLFGQTIEVEYDNELYLKHNKLGLADLDKNKIFVSPSKEPHGEEQEWQSFWHEVIHHIFFKMGEDSLYKDERIVDLLGSLIHQATTTMEYEVEKPKRNANR